MKLRAVLVAMILALPLLLMEPSGVSAQPVLKWPPNSWTLDTLTPSFLWQTDGYTHLWVAQRGSSTPVIDVVLPKGQDNFTVPQPLAGGTLYRWRIRSNPYPPSQSVYTWSPWTTEYTFTTPGSASWKDSALVRLVSPPNGSLSSIITPTLSWMPPAGATLFEMAITPAGNERAGVRFVQRINSNFPIPGPPGWYGMLPDTLYYWSLRVTNSPVPVPGDHPSWGPWSEVWAFRTPVPPSEVIAPLTPARGEAVATQTPTLSWRNPNDQVFYYEVQVSRDPGFTTDPSTATSPVYWETIHGGLTGNSYAVPSRYPLERGQVYHWRVRPAVPSAARPVAWSPSWTFRVR